MRLPFARASFWRVLVRSLSLCIHYPCAFFTIRCSWSVKSWRRQYGHLSDLNYTCTPHPGLTSQTPISPCTPPRPPNPCSCDPSSPPARACPQPRRCWPFVRKPRVRRRLCSNVASARGSRLSKNTGYVRDQGLPSRGPEVIDCDIPSWAHLSWC